MSAGSKLARALVAMAQSGGCTIRIASASERPWASATFVGARHALIVEAADSPALHTWLGTLAEAEFGLPGHLVADVSVQHGAGRARVSALTLVAA
ncbi:hypothetical protein [Sphingomonas sp.]|jgi:hypothetical protein|uniref:hypothetical protein n=1 Tax=Sphingomonas sp. TaxID=28214 RepID=UPI002EDA95A4